MGESHGGKEREKGYRALHTRIIATQANSFEPLPAEADNVYRCQCASRLSTVNNFLPPAVGQEHRKRHYRAIVT